MLAQVSLTPAESKKLIAKAVVNMEVIKKAVAEGIVVMHPSSSTIFIAEELTGEMPKTQVWVCGVVTPKGTCMSGGASKESGKDPTYVTKTPDSFTHSWVVEGKRLSTGIRLGDLLARLGPKDVYIKGVNALDTEGTVGVLFGSKAGAGTIGRVMAAYRQKGFSLIFPVGLEKLVPVRIGDAAKEAHKSRYEYATGECCGLLPCKGIVVTELKAIEILSGATAIPIAAGGLDGAEGAVTLVIKGEKQQVNKAIEYVEQSKGARLPKADSPRCEDCRAPNCEFPVKGKPWVVSAQAGK